jgi:hypothetical protein
MTHIDIASAPMDACAFVWASMSRNDEARSAISSLDGSMVGNKRLKVDEARPERNKSWADQ